jgi:hypothetical protein
MGGPPEGHDGQLGHHEGERDAERSGATRRTTQSSTTSSSWADEMDEHDKSVAHRNRETHHEWVYHEAQAAVLHLDGCVLCRAYATHKFESSMTGDQSLEAASYHQRKHLSGATRYNLTDAQTAIARKDSELTLLERDNDDLRRQIHCLEDELHDEARDGPSRKHTRRTNDETGPSTESQSTPPAVAPPAMTSIPTAPQMAPQPFMGTSSQPTAASYAEVAVLPPNPSSSMDQDYPPLEPSSGPPYGRGNVPFHSLLMLGKHKLPNYSGFDQTVRASHLAKQARINKPQGIVPPCGKMPIDNRGFPTDEDEWNTLITRANATRNYEAYNLAKAFISMVQAMPGPERPPYYHAALTNWRTPEWACQLTAHPEPSTSQQSQAPPGQRPMAFRDDGFPKLNQPTMASTPKEWAAWLWVYRHENAPPPGLLIPLDGCIPLRHI